MKSPSPLYLFTFVVSACSILYELLLSQALTAFMGDTVLRFSVTIGLYLFSMGIGALLTGERLAARSAVSLLALEIALAVIGSVSVILLHVMHALAFSPTLFAIAAHLLIVLIGVLTGGELPLLIRLQQGDEQKNATPTGNQAKVLALNYLGALFGTLCFAFYIYPGLGILPGALLIGFFNSLAGLLLIAALPSVAPADQRMFKLLYRAQGAISICLVAGLWNSNALAVYFLAQYLGVTS